jgi:predicted kinase
MAKNITILRGNSGSGKTTVATQLQKLATHPTALVSQDMIRRQILKVKDTDGNPSIDLIEQIVKFAWQNDYDVIVEGILSAERYEAMLKRLVRACEGKVFAYYFDIPFEETLKRHTSKPNAHEFGEKEMRDWWKDKDFLGLEEEVIIDESLDTDAVVSRILQDTGIMKE